MEVCISSVCILVKYVNSDKIYKSINSFIFWWWPPLYTTQVEFDKERTVAIPRYWAVYNLIWKKNVSMDLSKGWVGGQTPNLNLN